MDGLFFLHTDGGSPSFCLNILLKCAKSANPTDSAKSLKLISEVEVSFRLASSIRRLFIQVLKLV